MSQTDDLNYATIGDLAPAIRSQELSPVELTDAMLKRIASVDEKLNSYVTVMAESARVGALKAQEEIEGGNYRGLLHGIPVAVKDLCYTHGVPTTGGLRVLRNFVPEADATVVERLRAAGAIVLGKLNLTEGAMAGYHRDFDIPVNPWNESTWSGVSSSGSGVATAAGLCVASLGSDTGGSIRFPSAANGIVGLKPTWGRVSRHGVLALSETLDHIGPMTRSVYDSAVVLAAIAGVDINDPTSLSAPVPDLLHELEAGIHGVRIGYDANYSSEGTDPELLAAVEEAVATLKDLGATVVEIKMPESIRSLGDDWFTICSAEAVRAHAAWFPSQAGEYGEYFSDFLNGGTEVTSEQYAASMAVRYQFSQEFVRILNAVDAIVSPAAGASISITPGMQYGGVESMAPFMAPLQMHFTVPADFAGTPTLTLPCGRSTTGNPFGLQLMGSQLTEPMLCRIGHAYESATEWHKLHPPL
ncbi:MAG: amidase [Pseudomonadales bacterium]